VTAIASEDHIRSTARCFASHAARVERRLLEMIRR
jgi:hypothetical protein